MTTVADLVVRAVCAPTCALPAGCRHLALTLAHLADWRTGRGIAGQGRLARAMGVDVRTVQRLKRQLAEAADSPVTVTWRHRQRADGLNGSDAYVIGLRRHPTDLQGHPTDLQTHPTDCRTNITTGFPIGNTLELKEENEFIGGHGPSARPLLRETRLPPNWRPNVTHERSAKRLGVDLEEAAAAFAVYYAERVEARTAQGWAAGFGEWLRRRATVAKVPSPAEIEAAEIVAWKESLRSGAAK